MRQHRTIVATWFGAGAILWLVCALVLVPGLPNPGRWLWVCGLTWTAATGALVLILARATARQQVAALAIAREVLVLRTLRRASGSVRGEQAPGQVAQSVCEILTAEGAYEAVALVVLGLQGSGRTWAESGFGGAIAAWLARQTDDDLVGLARKAALNPHDDPSRVAWESSTGVIDSAAALGFVRDDGSAGLLLVRGTAENGGLPRWEIDLLRDTGRDALGALGGASEARLRHDAEAALGESQRTLATLLSNLPGMAYRCLNDDRWTMLFVSEGSRRLTGYGPEDLTDSTRLSYADLILPEDLERVRATVEDALARGTSFELRYRIRSAGGEVRCVWEQGRRIRAAEGGVDVLEGLVLDITESERVAEEREALLKQVQVQAARLQETAAQLQQIMASVPEGVLLLDADYRVVLANPPAERALAVLDTALTDGGALLRLGNHAMADLLIAPRRQGMWHQVRAGQRIFATIAKPVEHGPVVEGWVLVLNEITQEREALQRTQQQERLAAVGQLAAGVAHDFNNVLAVVVLYSQMALQVPKLPSKVREYMKTIAREAGRGGDLIQQILDFGRQGMFDPVALDLAPFLEEQATLLRHTLPATVRVDLHRDAGTYMVRADPSRLRQAIVNLSLNARDAMEDGGTLTLALGRATADGQHAGLLSDLQVLEWIQIAVTDTGHGIAPDVLPRIFEPFFTTKGSGGNGLGLAQVHGIVGQHDGVVDVASEPGKGTTFTIYLPALDVPSSGAPPTGALRRIARGNGQAVLLVEDHEIARRTLANALDYQGYRVLTVRSGLEALAVLDAQGLVSDVHVEAGSRDDDTEAQGIALIICDLALPDLGTAVLLRALRERSVPVIGLARQSAQAGLAPLGDDGLVGWLPTPPGLEALHAMVAKALGTAQA